MHNRPVESESEGVIKFSFTHTVEALDSFGIKESLHQLILWRTRLNKLGFVGCDPSRYGGLGFGNLSARIGADTNFLITATQTGHIETLTSEHFCLVSDFDLDDHRLHSNGPRKPSSEAMTHAAIYQALPRIAFVFHCHAPEIWQNRSRLALTTTPDDTAYGTPEMAAQISHLLSSQLGVIAMGGHQDGILAVGENADAAGNAICQVRERALALV